MIFADAEAQKKREITATYRLQAARHGFTEASPYIGALELAARDTYFLLAAASFQADEGYRAARRAAGSRMTASARVSMGENNRNTIQSRGVLIIFLMLHTYMAAFYLYMMPAAAGRSMPSPFHAYMAARHAPEAAGHAPPSHSRRDGLR